jgi:hypothetical protein
MSGTTEGDGMGTTLDVIDFFSDGRPPEQAVETNPVVIRRLEAGRQAQQQAQDAYRPAIECYGRMKLVRTAYSFNRVLKKNPWIRTRLARSKAGVPIKRRPLIHVGDWHEYLRKTYRKMEPRDLPDHIVEAYEEACQESDAAIAAADQEKKRTRPI